MQTFARNASSSVVSLREGGILPGLSSPPQLMPGLGVRAADGECHLFVELATDGGSVAGIRSSPAAPTFGGSPRDWAPAARRCSTTRDRAEDTKISITQLVQDDFIPIIGGDDMVSEVIGQVVVGFGQHTSGNEFSNSTSLPLQGAEDDEQVNIDAAALPGTPVLQLIRALGTMSFLTMAFAISTALYQPAEGVLFGRSKVVYYLTLGAIFASGVAEAITACWLSRSRDAIRQRFIFGRVLLCASVVPFVAILGIGGRCFINR